MDESTHLIEVLQHPLGIHDQLVHHAGQAREREVEGDRGVGGDVALDRRVADVALVP